MIITWGNISGSILWALVMGVAIVAVIAVAYAVMRRRERGFSGAMPDPAARERAELDHLYATGRIDRAEYDRRTRALGRRR